MIKTWINSLEIFAPRNIKVTIVSSLSRFYKASQIMVKHFYPLLLVDIIWVCVFYDVIAMALQSNKTDPSLRMSSLLLIWSINWFVLTTCYLISILQSHSSFSSAYYADKILRYAQLYLMIPLFILASILILSYFGIVYYPLPHWSFIAITRIVGYVTIFYWMDSRFSNLDILKSIERAANFFLYNLPAFLTIFGIHIVLIMLLVYPFSYHIPCTFNTVGMLFQSNYFSSILPHFHHAFSIILRTLILRYGMLCIDYYIVSLIFFTYRQKKSDCYAVSFFD